MVACYKNKNDYNSGANNRSVYMKGSVFSIPSLQVSAGSTVTWINDDNTTHTVTANDGNFNSGDMAPGARFNMTFSTTGTYPYHCMHHSQMTGTVVVVNSTSGSSGY